jgi:hypothetical protein
MKLLTGFELIIGWAPSTCQNSSLRPSDHSRKDPLVEHCKLNKNHKKYHVICYSITNIGRLSLVCWNTNLSLKILVVI